MLLELLERERERVNVIRRSQFAFDPQRSSRSVEEHDELLKAIRTSDDMGFIEKLARFHKLRTMRQYVTTDHSSEN